MNMRAQVTRPAFQIGHALTTLGLLFGVLTWVVAADKEQAKDISSVQSQLSKAQGKQEIILEEQRTIKDNQMKALEILHQIKGQLGGN